MNRRLLSLCTIFLLLFAQHAAVAHALFHAHAASHHGAVAATPAENPAPADPASLCAFDTVYSQVLGSASGTAPVLAIDAAPVAGASLPADTPVVARFNAPLSRGPPTLL